MKTYTVTLEEVIEVLHARIRANEGGDWKHTKLLWEVIDQIELSADYANAHRNDTHPLTYGPFPAVTA